MSFLRDQLSLLREFLKSDFRKLLLWCAVGLLGAIAVGAVLGLVSPEAVEQAIATITQVIEQAGVIDADGQISVFALLNNNWSAMLTALLYGVIPFICLPALNIVSNGFLLGILGAWYVTSQFSLAAYLAGLLPHGIFELPALVLSCACGLRLCQRCTRLLTHHADYHTVLETLADVLRVMVLMVAPMLIAAAFIECYITPIIMSFFL